MLDARLPLLLRIHQPLDPDPAVTEHRWDGRILTAEEAGYRHLHADATGCWITGPDGTHRATDGGVHQIDDAPVGLAAASTAAPLSPGATLAVQVPAVHDGHAPLLLRLHHPPGEPIDVELPDHGLVGLVPHAAGFLLELGRGEQRSDPQPTWSDREPWLAHLSTDGSLREGPRLPIRRRWRQLVPTDPPLLHDDPFSSTGRLRRVRDDLTLEDGTTTPRKLLAAHATQGRLWATMHPPRPGDLDRDGAPFSWPRTVAPVPPERRQHWLLTELDADTLAVRASTLVAGIPRDITVDGSGTAWFLADGVRHLPPPAVPEVHDDGTSGTGPRIAGRLDVEQLVARPAPEDGHPG